MARTVTTAALLSRIRARGDIRSNRHSDAVLKDWIDESWAELYDLMIGVNADYFLSSGSISVVSGTGSYSLPADFYKIAGLDIPIGGQQVQVGRFNFAERNKNQLGLTDRSAVRYRVKGGSIYFRPTPNFTATATIWYIPAPAKTAAADGSFDGISGWEEYVVSDVCMKAAMADEEDYQPFMLQREAARKRILSVAADRDVGEPDRVRDVDDEYDSIYRFY